MTHLTKLATMLFDDLWAVFLNRCFIAADLLLSVAGHVAIVALMSDGSLSRIGVTCPGYPEDDRRPVVKSYYRTG